ncbi:MAG: hypothetical protein JXB07_08045 [Anaerolineae bacterium]|nr:hypothetical protein [Anaerolineae bacterium]
MYFRNTIGDPRQERRWTWLSAGLLLVLCLIFMGKTLFPPADQMLIGNDLRGLFYPWLTLARESILAGKLPLWDASQLGGQPFINNPQVGLFYPPTWLTIVLPVTIGLSWYVLLHLWLAGYGMVLFVRRASNSWVGALLSGLTVAFSGFMVARIEAGHAGLLATHAWIPWILLAYRWSVTRKDVWSAMVAGLPFGLAILAGHTSSLLYVGSIWIAYAVYLGWSEQRWLSVIRQFAISGALGLALSAIQIIPFVELAMLSTRVGGSVEDFGRWSMPPFHLIALIIPTYFGEPVHIGWWSVENFEELTYYVGALPLLAIPLALRKPTRLTWLYLGLMITGLLIALGSYGFLYQILWSLLPPFRLARVPARAAFLFVFGASALLGETIAAWNRLAPEARYEALKPIMRWMLLIIAVIGLIGLAATGAAFTVFHPSDTGGRLWHQAGGWAWALVAFLGGGALLWRYLIGKHECASGKRVLVVALAALVVADLWFFGFKLLQLRPASPAPLWVEAKPIVGDTPQRIVPWAVGLFIQNDAALVGMNSILGYNVLEVAAYHDFAIGIGDPRSTAYDILGVEYVLSPQPLEGDFIDGDRPVQLVTSTDSVWVYRRSRVMPIARLAYQVEVIDETWRARARVHEPAFEPANTVTLDTAPSCRIGPAPEKPGTAEIIEHSPGYWLIETESSTPALHVLSETAYPGWRATIDGEEVQSLTAYTTIRAVCVPAGEHRIEWVFDPITYKIGAGVTLPALLLCGWAGVMVWRGRKQTLLLPDEEKEDTR